MHDSLRDFCSSSSGTASLAAGVRNRFVVLVPVLALLLLGCGQTWQALDPSSLAATQPRSITLLRRSPLPFFAAPPGTELVGGMIGAGVMQATGSGILRTNSIADPSVRLGDALLAGLAQKYRLTPSTVTVEEPSENDSQREIQNVPIGQATGDLLLSVRTIQWSVQPRQRDRLYFFHHDFQVKLLDSKTKKLISGGDCDGSVPAPDDPGAPSFKAMLDDNAKILKELIDKAVTKCLSDCEARLFFTSTGSPSAIRK